MSRRAGLGLAAAVGSWREVATIKDIAAAEGVTDPFVSRFLRLAYLAPDVLEGLLIRRRPCVLSLER